MTEHRPPPPPRPKRPPTLEDFRPSSERSGSPLQQLRPPGGQPQHPRHPGAPPPVTQRYAPPPRRPAPPDPDDEGRSWFVRLLLWLFGAFALVMAAAAIALVVFSPADLVREQLVARVKAKTGRELVVAGGTSLSFYPNLGVSMRDVSLSPPPGMAGAPTIRMETLEASVPVLPLLERRIKVERLLLRRPVIDLRIDAQGRRSWDFAGLVPSRPLQYAQAGGMRPGQMPKELNDFVKSANPDSVEAATSRGAAAALEALSLADMRIEGGVVRYADERSGVGEEIQALDARLALASLSSPLEAKGSLVWRAEPVAFDMRLTSPKLLGEERPARLSLKIDGRPLDLGYDGTVTAGRAPDAEGALTVKSPSLKALLLLLGLEAIDDAGLGAAAISGRLKASDQALTLSEAKIELPHLTATGTLGAELRPGRPLIRGNLQVAELDLNALALPRFAATASRRPALKPAAPSPAPARPGPGPAKSIEDLLKADQPPAAAKVRGYTRRADWSDDVIDVTALGLVDADVKLGLGRLIYREIKVGATHLRVALKDRALTATFDDIALYDGQGRGLVTVDGTGATPKIGANFSVDNASALPLLKDAADFDWVSGKAKVQVALGGQGASERQIVGTLVGKADIHLQNGAVIGYDVEQILKNISQGKFGGLERSAAAKTSFSEVAASVSIQNGIATNKDLRLVNPHVRLTGAGTADMPHRTLDYTLRPKVVAAGGPGSGLEVPVKVTGSWDKPMVAADLDAVLKNPEQAVDTLKEIGKQFKEANPEAVDKAKQLFRKFFKP